MLFEKVKYCTVYANDKSKAHVTSYSMVYLPRFIYFLHFSQLKAVQILPQNKHKSVIEAVVI